MTRLTWMAAMLLAAWPGAAQEREILAVLERSVEDWNRADIPAFMRCYEDSAETTFVGKEVVKGTAAVRERYRKSYPDAEHMGKLEFRELAVRMVNAGAAIVTGRFVLERTAKGGGAARGIFTLVMRKGAAGWRIVHDHTTGL